MKDARAVKTIVETIAQQLREMPADITVGKTVLGKLLDTDCYVHTSDEELEYENDQYWEHEQPEEVGIAEVVAHAAQQNPQIAQELNEILQGL